MQNCHIFAKTQINQLVISRWFDQENALISKIYIKSQILLKILNNNIHLNYYINLLPISRKKNCKQTRNAIKTKIRTISLKTPYICLSLIFLKKY